MALVKGTNSYVTVSEADILLLSKLNSSAWEAAAVGDKEKALITATSILDEMPWAGTAISEGQPLAFPRYVEYFDPKLGTLVTVDGTTPTRVTNACIELANHLLLNTDVLTTTTSVDSISVGNITLNKIEKAATVPLSIKKILNPLLINAGSNTWWRAN